MQAGRRKVPQEEKGGRRDSHNRTWTTTHASRANCTRPTAATGYAAKLKRIASLNDDFKKKQKKKNFGNSPLPSQFQFSRTCLPAWPAGTTTRRFPLSVSGGIVCGFKINVCLILDKALATFCVGRFPLRVSSFFSPLLLKQSHSGSPSSECTPLN